MISCHSQSNNKHLIWDSITFKSFSLKKTLVTVQTCRQRCEQVAIKEARVEGDNEENLAKIQQNVLQEAKLFWMLRHPNIIQLKGICFEKPHFCLIMEYAKGV